MYTLIKSNSLSDVHDHSFFSSEVVGADLGTYSVLGSSLAAVFYSFFYYLAEEAF